MERKTRNIPMGYARLLCLLFRDRRESENDLIGDQANGERFGDNSVLFPALKTAKDMARSISGAINI